MPSFHLASLQMSVMLTMILDGKKQQQNLKELVTGPVVFQPRNPLQQLRNPSFLTGPVVIPTVPAVMPTASTVMPTILSVRSGSRFDSNPADQQQLLDQVLKSLPSSTTATKIKPPQPSAVIQPGNSYKNSLAPGPSLTPRDVTMTAVEDSKTAADAPMTAAESEAIKMGDDTSLTSGLFSRQISFTELLEGSSEQLFSEISDLAVPTPFLDEVFQQHIKV